MAHWEELDALLDMAPGSYSVCVLNERGAQIYAYNADRVQPAASLIKVPLCAALYDAAAEGQLDLDAELTVLPEHRVDGDGLLDAGVPESGLRMTLRQLAGHALRESDNTASNLLIKQVGFDAANTWLAAHGLRDSVLQRRFMDFEAARAGRENRTSAADAARFLLPITVEQRYAELLNVLFAAEGDQKLVAGLPPGTPIAHKVGELDNAEHDLGLIITPRRRLIVAALSSDWPAFEDGHATIAAIASFLYHGDDL